MAIEIMLFFWPVTIIIVLQVFAASVITKALAKFSNWSTFLQPFVFPLIIVSVGGFFRHTEGGRTNAPLAPQIAVQVLFWTQVLLSLFLIYRRKGLRWLTAAVYTFGIWLSLNCWFVSGMALTNVWL
ncbi:MAG: hypothetical protein ABJA02_03420 [Acidobacteriota bacterium]